MNKLVSGLLLISLVLISPVVLAPVVYISPSNEAQVNLTIPPAPGPGGLDLRRFTLEVESVNATDAVLRLRCTQGGDIAPGVTFSIPTTQTITAYEVQIIGLPAALAGGCP